MLYTVVTVLHIITVTIKVPSFGDVNTLFQIILLKQTLISGSQFLTKSANNTHRKTVSHYIKKYINLQQMLLQSFLKCL